MELVTKVPKKNLNLRLYVEKTIISYGEKYSEFMKREAEINKIIERNNIAGCIKAFDSIFSKDKNPLIIKMEFASSINLGQLMVSYGALPEATAKSILFPAIAALGCLHDHGIVYRDFKPANIIVSANNDTLEGKLIDFGIAKELGAETIKQTVIGTPETISPEACEGRVSLRSDIYSVGATLFFVLFNKPLFRIEGIPTVQSFTRQYAIPKGRNLSLACIDFLQRCLQINPENRFSSMKLLLDHDFFKCNSYAATTYAERDYQLTTAKLTPI